VQINDVKVYQFQAKETSSTPQCIHFLFFTYQLAVVTKKESLLTGFHCVCYTVLIAVNVTVKVILSLSLLLSLSLSLCLSWS